MTGIRDRHRFWLCMRRSATLKQEESRSASVHQLEVKRQGKIEKQEQKPVRLCLPQ